MTTPPYLKKGDKIGLAATARKVSASDIDHAVQTLKSWGLELVLADNLLNSHNQFAGTDEERIQGFQNLLDDENVKAIICARGGYGTLRIIDDLNFSGFDKNPKWIVGFSDITVLHSHILSNLKTECIHGPMLINFPKSEDAVESLRIALLGELKEYAVETHPFNRKGKCKGQLMGGNLSLLQAINGSASDIKTKGKILFIEDLDEQYYHLDRMMLNLKRSGKLENLAGLIVGGMTEMKDNAIPYGKNAEEIIFDAIKEYDYPVCFNFPAGHIDKNLALILGRKIKLEVGESVKIRF